MKLEDLRREYALARLDESSVEPDPFAQFEAWFGDANRSGVLDPHAMTLATAGLDGRPSARVVLLKDLSPAGLVFFTDYRSRKSQELDANPQATVLFYWGELERQVRITGRVARTPRETAEAYFTTRPVGSQLGAWASRQSEVLPGGRAELDGRLREVTSRYAGGPVPLPPHWGGWRLVPDEFEFWQGRESRLHDRIRYRLDRAAWVIERLSP
jgi:pyridoxamine 5'-phosphate oxidase